jgi:probable addiction module antidote protein
MVKLQPFDTAQHLDNPEVIHWYLSDALDSGEPKLFLRALQNVARANNMSKIAREIGMSRTSLYWGENTSPEFTTVQKLLERIGVRLRVEPIASKPRKLAERHIAPALERLQQFAREMPPPLFAPPIENRRAAADYSARQAAKSKKAGVARKKKPASARKKR